MPTPWKSSGFGWLLAGLIAICSAPGYARAEPVKPGPAVQALVKVCHAKLGASEAAMLGHLRRAPGRRGVTIVARTASGEAAKKGQTARLLGEKTGSDVYRVDLSAVISKYIGETEKNIEKAFKEATRRNAILFFDEADALFGKRSDFKKAKDRLANKQSSRILDRIKAYRGVVVLGASRKLTPAGRKSASQRTDVILPAKVTAKKLWPAVCPVPAK